MSDRVHPPRRPRRGNPYRALIHLLNSRYHEQWERAERLERELARARSGLSGWAGAWLRHCKRWLRPARYAGRPGTRPGELARVPCRLLEESAGPVSGRVSVIIPFRDGAELLRGCLSGLRRDTYPDVEVILVDNGSTHGRTRRLLDKVRGRPGFTVLECPGAFNFSFLCNEGARVAAGEYLLFLNNDTETLHPICLERLVRVACLPEVGVAGATLLYPDGTLQHAGLFPRADGVWVHGYRGLPADAAGDHGELASVRTVPAVTGACLMVRRDLFRTLGGFDERLPVAYNDVDLCGRARAHGLLVAVTPHARLLHFEGLSRGFSCDSPPGCAGPP